MSNIQQTSLVGDAAIAMITKLAMTALFSLVPWLGFPGLNLIVGFLFGKLLTWVLGFVSKVYEFKIIDIRIDGENDEFKAAREKLKNIPPNTTEEEIEKDKEKFFNSGASLIRFK